MRIDVAYDADIPGWLRLASEVEALFGPMLNDPAFHRALRNNIGRGTAFCAREHDGPPGSPLLGAVLFSPTHAPFYRISWLAVAQHWRGQGVGRLLVQHVLELVQPPAELVVVTFGEDVVAGRPAQRFYEHMGFVPAEPARLGPEGGSRQVFRRVVLC